MATVMAGPGSGHHGGASPWWLCHDALLAGLVLSLAMHALLLGMWSLQPTYRTNTHERNLPELQIRLTPMIPMVPKLELRRPNSKLNELQPVPDESPAAPAQVAVPQGAPTPEIRRESGGVRIDLEAARDSARRMGADAGRGQSEPSADVTAQQGSEPKGDRPLARAIDRSTRASCVEQGAGYGLLAPLYHAFHLAADQPGTGCRY